ncbi:AraC family transcriptional regulator [Aquimarina sp. ERC-38]|uniref:AraC family transcriptional regulator n=1 Tax=Aquimarina sp. ERC-38 TaxID=2949996 RepID=UPI002246491D|nr:AraC family transcriptional regulator [Aquimarina sp. ERC-38]UZO82608.1 AraC family transcriptional regulator [Aquimarina sp. ERC-38]
MLLPPKIEVSLEKIETSQHVSFHTGVYKQPYFNGNWHYHPEFELLLIVNGQGKRLVADHGEDFKVGDIVLLGGYLPHAWIPDAKYLKENSTEYCESVYVQFKKDIFGSHFVDIPELKGVRKVLRSSERGIKIEGKYKNEIIELLKGISKFSPLDQLLKLIKILDLINLSGYQILASEGYLNNSFYFKSNRIIKVHEFMMEHYKQDVSLNECAEMVNMTVSAFCRYFKSETNYTFTNYLNKVRIDFAKKLLINTNIPIKEIAFDCGYNSVPYFNRQFKKLEQVSPYTFRKSVKE